VLHPMGWDAYGLPAEQYAVEKNVHPRITTRNNIDTFRRQIKSLGFSYDWDREVDTTDPAYFKWTQWIFLTIYDTWYDAAQQKGRPIGELPIPDGVRDEGPDAVRKYQDAHRLAYQAEVPVNWCPALGTVLANEEVIDGKSERGSHPVERRPLRQWLMRITAYAERLLDDLEPLDWSHSIKEMQRNWIGRSEGAEVHFTLQSTSEDPQPPASPGSATPGAIITVFTTRPDTLFGATYMVLSPEHSLVSQITTTEQKGAVETYQLASSRKSDFERTETAKTKTGVFTGAYAVNPVNDKQIPIWIADYVLATYGTGAIMAVPGHDERDFAFAKQFGLPIVQVVDLPPAMFPAKFREAYRRHYTNDRFAGLFVAPDDSQGALRERVLKAGTNEAQNGLPLIEVAYFDAGTVMFVAHQSRLDAVGDILKGKSSISVPLNDPMVGEGVSVNSGILDGLSTPEAKAKIIAWLEEKGIGTRRVNYKLRDWLFSRQRYWGEPFPVLHGEDGDAVTLSQAALPLIPPDLEDFKPTGTPDGPLSKATDWVNVTIGGKNYRRETNTMPQWAGSCWYFLRYIDPRNGAAFADPAKLKYWLPVDLYVGGAEHAVLHLLYARFWHKVLFDRGYLPCPEPFQRLVNQGMILGENGEKMSKARGNVVNPDDVVKEYGADSLRLYEMFMGPLEAVKPWNTASIAGVYKFLNRAWRLMIDDGEEFKLSPAVQDTTPDRDTLRVLHQTIQKVTKDTEGLSFNTAIAEMMKFVNHMTGLAVRPRSALEPFVLLLAPYAPHVAEELWRALGHTTTLAYEHWPLFDAELAKEDEIEIPVQIGKKVIARLKVAAEIDDKALEEAAMADEAVKTAIAGKTVKMIKVVPRRLVNIVVV